MPDLLLELFSEEIPASPLARSEARTSKTINKLARSEARTRKTTIKALHVRSAN